MATRIVFFASFFVSIFASGTVLQKQEFPSFDEALRNDYSMLKTLVEQHLAQRKKSITFSSLDNIISGLDNPDGNPLKVHARETDSNVANYPITSIFLGEKHYLDTFGRRGEKVPEILNGLLEIPLNRWPVPFDAHCFLAWVFKRPGFDLALWLKRWFESNFLANIKAAYKADNAVFMKYILVIPHNRKLPETFPKSRSLVIKYDAVNILEAFYHLNPDHYRYITEELVEANAIKITKYLKAKGAFKSFSKEYVDMIITRKLAGLLEVALEFGHKLTIGNVFLAVQHNSYDCIRFMNEKEHEIVIEGLFQAFMHNRILNFVEFIKAIDIKFSQDDLNLLGGYLPPEAINYIYCKQGIVPKNPMTKGPSIEVMEIEEQQANKLDHNSLVDSFKKLDLNDPPVINHHRACTFIDKVIDSITDNERSVSERLMDGKLLDYYLGVAKNYGIKVSAAYKLLSSEALPKKDPSEYFVEALKDDLVGIYWALQAASLKRWADKRMAHQFLIKVFEHPYSYNEESWHKRCQKADFFPYTSEIYSVGNQEFLRKAESLTCGASKVKWFNHSKRQFLDNLSAIADRDAVETVKFIIDKYPGIIKDLKGKENLFVEKRAVKILRLLQKHRIIPNFRSDQIASFVRENNAAMLEFALESGYVLKRVDLRLAIQRNACECITVMKNKDFGMVKKVVKEVLLSDPWSVSDKAFKILEVDLAQEDVNRLPLNVSARLVEYIFKTWGILPRISQMKKPGTIELGLVRYLKTLPLNKNLDDKQAFSYFENIKDGKYDEVTKLRLLEYYLFVAMNQFRKTAKDAYHLADRSGVARNPSKIYLQTLEDRLAYTAKYLQAMPESQWSYVDEMYFFLASIWRNVDFSIGSELEPETEIDYFIGPIIAKDSFDFLEAVFATNNPSIFAALHSSALAGFLEKEVKKAPYEWDFVIANDAVEMVSFFANVPEIIDYFENHLDFLVAWDSINIILFLTARNPLLEFPENAVFLAIVNDSSYALEYLLKGRKLTWLEVILAASQDAMTCLRVMLVHDTSFVKGIADCGMGKTHLAAAPQVSPDILDLALGDRERIVMHKKKGILSIANARHSMKYSISIKEQGSLRAEICLSHFPGSTPFRSLIIRNPEMINT